MVGIAVIGLAVVAGAKDQTLIRDVTTDLSSDGACGKRTFQRGTIAVPDPIPCLAKFVSAIFLCRKPICPGTIFISDGMLPDLIRLQDEAFRIGRLSFDEFSGLFLVDLAEFTFLSDVQLLGVPIGYCPASERNKKIMRFEPLRLAEKA